MFCYAMKIETRNDASGNPRRGYLIYDDVANLVGFADEDYDGQSRIFKRVQETLSTELDKQITIYLQGIIEVPVSEYNTAKKHRQL